MTRGYSTVPQRDLYVFYFDNHAKSALLSDAQSLVAKVGGH